MTQSTPSKTVHYEAERLSELFAYQILDTDPEPGFDNITALLAELCAMPTVVVSLVDETRQWFKSRVGISACETSRSVAFCDKTIRQFEPLEVTDARADPRFCENPLVTGDPYIRYYYGVPLTNHKGFNLGSLCLIDYIPREVPAQHKWLAQMMARHVMSLLDYRRRFMELRQSYTQTDLHQHLQLLNSCVANLQDQVIITEAQGPDGSADPRILYVNDAFERITGYSREEVVGRTPKILQGLRTQRSQLDRLREAFLHQQSASVEMINYRKDGEAFWVAMDIMPVANDDAQITHYLGIARDITERKQYEDRVQKLAYRDQLTNLPNREVLFSRLTKLIQDPARNTGTAYHALLFLDLDDFKNVNDTLGHIAGDKLLREAATRLKRVVRNHDIVARVGGDEFVVVLEQAGHDYCAAAQNAMAVGEKIINVFREKAFLDEQQYRVTPSIGVRVLDVVVDDAEALLRDADIALYSAKEQGKGQARLFEPAMAKTLSDRVRLEADLRQAIAENQFVMHYQPQTDRMGELLGYEALIRWNHPTRGLIMPNDFLPLAEAHGLIGAIGQWALSSVARQIVDWSRHGLSSEFRIAINISGAEFHDPEFVSHVISAIEDAGGDPNQIKLEITESVMLEDIEAVIQKMTELKAFGIEFSLDDFGTGFSSLYYLKRLPISEIKIDRSFVQDLGNSHDDNEIVHTILDMCRNLGLRAIAEGVETTEQLDNLAYLGCTRYQGYLFGRPAPADSCFSS